MPLKILLAEDHEVVREGLRALLEVRGFAVVGTASDGAEAVSLCGQLQPDVAVLDFSMPSMNGALAAVEIRRVSPKTATVVLSAHREEPYVLEALRAGVRGYVLKTSAAGDLVAAIQEVSRGHAYLSPQVSGALVKAFLSKSELPNDPLSPRERQVLQLVAEGKTSKVVASQLGISLKTAESHRARIMEKLEIHETAGLVRYALRHGLTELWTATVLTAIRITLYWHRDFDGFQMSGLSCLYWA
jgi:DNA-binding NarL/FixJ family response regulator